MHRWYTLGALFSGRGEAMNVQVRWTGAETLALREALRMSQELFAEKAGTSVSAVKKWERLGPSIRLRPAFAGFMDDMLARANPAEAERFWRLSSSDQVVTRGSDNVGDVLQESADESAALLRWAESSNVGPMTIQDMRDDLRSITRAYLKTSTLPLFERARTIRDEAVELLRDRQTPQTSRELYGIAGWALTILGWMSVDLGKPDPADKHLRTAWAFAENADDDDLRAWVRASQHTASFWRDDFLAAAELARDGLRYARSGSAALFLSSAYALDLARAEQRTAATSALDFAVDVGDRLRELPQPDTFSGPFSCSVERATGMWADTCLVAQDAQRSLDYATTAVDGYDNTPAARRNLGSERMVRCQQVKAFLSLGYLDVATAQLSVVAETPAEHRVGPLVQRVNEIAWMAGKKGSAAGVGEIRDTATEFGRGRSLPALTSAED